MRGFQPHLKLKDFPAKATIATSSTRRKEQLLAARPDLKVVEIRGNVTTRMQKVAERGELDATVLALAGLTRLNFRVTPEGQLEGDAVPDGLLATILDTDVMLPCVGQGAIGIEIRADDERIAKICERLNHFNTFQCVTAERRFCARWAAAARVRWRPTPKLTATDSDARGIVPRRARQTRRRETSDCRSSGVRRRASSATEIKGADAGAGAQANTSQQFFGMDDWDKWRLNVSAA